MQLSIQQRYLMKLLRCLRYVRKDQLHALVKAQWRDMPISRERFETMLYQLRCFVNEVRVEGELVSLSAIPPDPMYLESIDIMLELSRGNPQGVETNLSSPRMLRFVWGQEKLRICSIAKLNSTTAPILIDRVQLERIVWLPTTQAMPKGLSLPQHHFLALRKEDGTHCFYEQDKTEGGNDNAEKQDNK